MRNRDVSSKIGFFPRLLAAAALSLPLISAAANIYKYQDEDGIWHFTDRAPDDEKVEFETVYMEREPEPRIRMRQEGTERNPVYMVFNDYWGPVELELSLSDAVNVLSEPELPARFVIPGQTEQTLLGIAALDPYLSFQYRLNLKSVPGPPTPEPRDDQVYYPPFPKGDVFPVSQGFNGTMTHATPDSLYAIDIVMPVDTLILAARGGTVMDVEEDFNRGGMDEEKYADKANHIRILHPDGTMSLYAHLGLASVMVRPGARIRRGQPIARSGNTGFSSGPHLHFAIQQNVGMELISVPFQFRRTDGSAERPQEGQYLEGLMTPL